MPSPDGRAPGIVGVRIAFIAILAILPAELAVQWLWSEPYPAITQPAFAFSANPLEAPDTLPITRGYITVTFTDGESQTYTADELLGWTAGVSPTTIIRDTIMERNYAPRDTVTWLRDRIAATGEDRQPVAAVLRLEFFRVNAHSLAQFDRGVSREMSISLSVED